LPRIGELIADSRAERLYLLSKTESKKLIAGSRAERLFFFSKAKLRSRLKRNDFRKSRLSQELRKAKPKDGISGKTKWGIKK